MDNVNSSGYFYTHFRSSNLPIISAFKDQHEKQKQIIIPNFLSAITFFFVTPIAINSSLHWQKLSILPTFVCNDL